MVIYMIYIFFNTNLQETYETWRKPQLKYDFFLLKYAWLWLISAACLYQWRIKKNIQKKKDTENKSG